MHRPESEVRRAALRTECRERLSVLQQAMEERGLAALVVLGRGFITQYGHLQYLVNYCPMIRLGALLLRAGAAPVLLLPTQADVVLARPWTAVEDLRVAPSGDDGTGSSALARTLHALSGDCERIGVVGLEDILVATEFERWQRTMPRVEFVSEAALLRRQKMVKSAREVAEIRAAAATADDGFEALLAALRRGESLRRAAGAAESELRAQGAGEVLVYLSRGPFYRHRPPPGHAESGDLLTVFVELSSETGYWAEFARLVAVGELDAGPAALASHCVRALDLLQSRLVAGAPAATVYRAVLAQAAESGFVCDGDVGHGFGMDHDGPAIAGRDDTAIEDGMAISVHPLFLSADGRHGASLGDAFIIERGLAVPLSRTGREPIVL